MPRLPAALSGLYFSNTIAVNPNVALASQVPVSGLTAVTLEAWVTVLYLPTYTARIASNCDTAEAGFELTTSSVSGGMKLTGSVGNNSAVTNVSGGIIPLNQLSHVAVSWDGTTIRIFLNGALLASGGLSGGNTGTSGHPFLIGNYQSGVSRPFPGIISEVRISNVVRYTANFTPPTAPFTPDANTVGLYHLNEGQGTIAQDSSSNANHGTLSGSPLPTWSDGKFFGQVGSRTVAANRATVQNFPCSLNFNGSKVIAPSISGLGSGFSFATWAKVPSASAGMLFGNATGSTDQAGVSINSNNLRGGYYNGSSYVGAKSLTGTKLPLNAWSHIVYTFDGTNGLLYVNGVLTSDGTFTPTISSTNAMSIGARNDGSVNFLGSMEQSLIYKRPISQAEVTALYQGGVIPANPYAQYNLTEGAGTTAYDTSGNGNSGTITSGVYTSDVPSRARGLVGGNLVYNGNFEFAPPTNVAQTVSNTWIDGTLGGSTPNQLFGWGFEVTNAGVSAIFDNTVSHSGNYSMKIATTSTSGNGIVSNTRAATSPAATDMLIPCLPNTQYIFSVWCMTSNVAAGAAFATAKEVIGNYTTSTAHNTSTLSGTNGWTQLSIVFTTGSTAAFLQVILRNNVVGNVGAVWFDDIVLTPTVNTTRGLAV